MLPEISYPESWWIDPYGRGETPEELERLDELLAYEEDRKYDSYVEEQCREQN